jgi:hypothetical protein
MSYAAIEESRHLGAPFFLYLFVYGSEPDAYYAYTNGEEPVTLDGKTYVPTPIIHGGIVSQPNLDKAALEIRTLHDSEISELFRIYPPTQVVSVFIRQGHVGDPTNEFLIVWTGRVLSAKRQINETALNCEAVATSMRRPGLRRNYQYGCPHVLYGAQCRANKLAATVTRRIINLTETTLTFQDGWDAPDRVMKYIGGLIEWNGGGGVERRTILRITSLKTITVGGILRGLSAGDSVNAVLGCDHQLDGDCINLHDNAPNYGGQPWIPLKNPIGSRNNYY